MNDPAGTDAPLRARLDLLRRTAEDAYSTGLVDVSLRAYRGVRDLAKEMKDEVEEEDAISWVGTCLFNLGRAEECLATLAGIVARLEESGSDEIRARARSSALKYWLWLSIHYKGRLSYLRDLIARAHRFFTDRGTSGLRDSLLLYEATIARYRGEFPLAVERAEEAVGVHREHIARSTFVFCEYLRAAARYRLDAGMLDGRAEELAREMMRVDRNIPYIADLRGHLILSQACRMRGRPGEALNHAYQADALARATTHRSSRAESRMAMARALLALGSHDAAQTEAEEAARQADEYHSELVRYDTRLCLLEVAADRLAAAPDPPRAARAGEAARAAWEAAQRIDPRLETAWNGDEVRRRWHETAVPALDRLGLDPGFPAAR